ncbi:MAG: hypothetical protein R3F49_00865 [Planctomycetota bacterium]
MASLVGLVLGPASAAAAAAGAASANPIPAAWSRGAQDVGAAPTLARAKAGAIVRNFEDAAGSELLRLEAGHPLRVYGKSAGLPPFFQVEVAGGVPVWVFGEHLQLTSVDGVLRVDSDAVNMRPMPEASPRSMALRTKLQRGTRVVLIARNNPAKPLAEDWVKVWAPETARVWVQTLEVDPVAANDSAATSAVQTAWVEAQRRVPTTRETPRTAPSGSARAEAERSAPLMEPIPTVSQDALRRVTQADIAFDAALSQPDASSTTWAEVVALYRETAAMTPEGTATRARAEERVLSADARRQVAELREQVQAEDDRRKRELAEIVATRERNDIQKSLHMGRFEGRGWLYSRVLGGERRWYLEWGGETVAEVRCSSARYDLEVFEGFELGVKATTVSPPVAASVQSEALPRVLDIMRVEVLSASTRRR